MRALTLLLFFLLFYSCQDKKTRVITKDVNESRMKPSNNEFVNVSKKADFRLTDKNVMEFLLDYGSKNIENLVRITTDYGFIDILLFEKTKFHRANFVYLTKKKYFNNTQFYRVITDFMIQGG